MRHFHPNMSAQRHQQILDESRAAGYLGSERLPASAHLEDTSESILIKALDAHAAGLAQREKERTP